MFHIFTTNKVHFCYNNVSKQRLFMNKMYLSILNPTCDQTTTIHLKIVETSLTTPWQHVGKSIVCHFIWHKNKLLHVVYVYLCHSPATFTIFGIKSNICVPLFAKYLLIWHRGLVYTSSSGNSVALRGRCCLVRSVLESYYTHNATCCYFQM